MTADPNVSVPETTEDLPDIYRSGRRKQVRAKTRRWLAYGIGAAVILVVALNGNWDKLGPSYFDWDQIQKQFPDIITIAAKNTLFYMLLAFVGGTLIGTSMALLRMSSIRPYRWFATLYVEAFRGLPALLTIVLVAQVTPKALDMKWPELFGLSRSMVGGIIALAMVAGAYLAETVRAGIQAVPKGQIEAARSLGMTHGQTLRKVVMPQAFRVIIPPLTNEMVLLLKDTSLLYVVGTTPLTKELTKFGSDAASKSFNGTPIIVAGFMYLMITIPLTRLTAYLEKRNEKAR